MPSTHGWVIEAHTLASVQRRTSESLREEFGRAKQWIAGGLGRGYHFAFSGAKHDTHAVAVTREFFATVPCAPSSPDCRE